MVHRARAVWPAAAARTPLSPGPPRRRQGPAQGRGAAGLARHRARRRRSSSTCATTRSRRCRWRWQSSSASTPSTSECVLEELAATVAAYDSLIAGGVDYAREVLERCARPRAGAGDHRPPVDRDRAPPVRVPAPHAARADRHVPAQRVAADDRAGRSPTCTPRSPPRCSRTCPTQSRPRSRCGSRAWARHRRTSSRRSRTSCARSSTPSSSRSTPPPAASSRWPTSSTTPTARPSATCSTRWPRPTRSSADEVRRLLFVFEDIIKLDDRSIQMVLREVDQKDLALALRGVPTRSRTASSANMSERGAQMLSEEMEFQPPQRKRVVEEAQGRIVASCASSRKPAPSSSRAAKRMLSSDRARRPRRPWPATRSSSSTPRRPRSAEEIADVLSAARAEADRIRERGSRRGRGRGSRSRDGRGPRELRSPRCRPGRAPPALDDAPRPARRRGSSSDAVELALPLAEQIVAGAHRRSSPSACVDVVRGALRRI